MKFSSSPKIAVVIVKYLFGRWNNIVHNGIKAEFLTTLTKLLLLKFEIVILYGNAWRFKDSFGNWNLIIEMLEKEVDVGLSHSDIKALRKEIGAFSFLFYVADKRFATELSELF